MPKRKAIGLRIIESDLDARRSVRARGQIAVDELERALQEDRPLAHRARMTLLYALTEWRQSQGALSLDQALGLVGPGFDHVLVADAKGSRDHAYLMELARLIAIGFKPFEADIAITERFAAAPPWGPDHPFLKPLKRSTVTSLRKQWLGLAADAGEGKTVKLYGRYFAEASAWSDGKRAEYLATYPGDALPDRFL